MDQAVADSSTFIRKMKDKDPQQIALEKTISDFWDTSDVPQESSPVKIAPYPSLESLNEEPKEELTEAEHEYYNRKRIILVEKMAIANDVYLAHLWNYDQEDPKNRSQKFLFQFNEVGNKLQKQFNMVAERLRLQKYLIHGISGKMLTLSLFVCLMKCLWRYMIKMLYTPTLLVL